MAEGAEMKYLKAILKRLFCSHNFVKRAGFSMRNGNRANVYAECSKCFKRTDAIAAVPLTYEEWVAKLEAFETKGGGAEIEKRLLSKLEG